MKLLKLYFFIVYLIIKVVNVLSIDISTHILDTSKGQPATNVLVNLYVLKNDNWQIISTEYNKIFVLLLIFFSIKVLINFKKHFRKTKLNGRVEGFKTNDNFELTADTYKLKYLVKDYFEKSNVNSMYPYVEVTFNIDNPNEHYHIPLLLTPYSFTTYRGT